LYFFHHPNKNTRILTLSRRLPMEPVGLQNIMSPVVDENCRHAGFRATIQGFLQTPAMMSLEHLNQWYANYKAASHYNNMDSDVIKQVQSDVLQTDGLRRGLDELSQKFSIRDQLCDICRCLLNDWPDISGPNAEDSPTVGWKHAVAAELHTLMIEAAARKGCQFCGLMMQIMQEAQMFQTIRKVEARIAYLKAVDMVSLSVENWATIERPNQIH
jgi:hypothetical protein